MLAANFRLAFGMRVYDLSGRAKIAATGGDRMRWMNGMVSTTFAILAAGRGVYAFLLNAQGRIQADLYVFQRGDSLLVDTERSQREKVLQLFDRYIIADDVETADISDRLTALGLTGPESRTVLERAGIAVPELAPLELCTPKCDCACSCLQCTLVRGDDSLGLSYEIWLTPDKVKSTWDALLAAGATAAVDGGAESFSHLARHSAIWRGHPRARSAAGNRADARLEFHQRLLSRTGDCGAHTITRRGTPAVHSVYG